MASTDGEQWAIGDVAAQLGIDADTIRYYERRAVLPPADRDAAGHRRYSPAAVHLIEVLLHLRDTGMPLVTIAEFTRLVATDPAGVRERLDILRRHRQILTHRIENWQRSLRVIDGKINDYRNRPSSD